MYKTPELIKKVRLDKIKVPNQDRIKEETGSVLDLQKAYEIIKEASHNFKLYDEKAIEADNLLASLIEKELKKETPEKEAKEVNAERASAARKRKLQLLKLKLQLEKENKSKPKK